MWKRLTRLLKCRVPSRKHWTRRYRYWRNICPLYVLSIQFFLCLFRQNDNAFVMAEGCCELHVYLVRAEDVRRYVWCRQNENIGRAGELIINRNSFSSCLCSRSVYWRGWVTAPFGWKLYFLNSLVAKALDIGGSKSPSAGGERVRKSQKLKSDRSEKAS